MLKLAAEVLTVLYIKLGLKDVLVIDLVNELGLKELTVAVDDVTLLVDVLETTFNDLGSICCSLNLIIGFMIVFVDVKELI